MHLQLVIVGLLGLIAGAAIMAAISRRQCEGMPEDSPRRGAKALRLADERRTLKAVLEAAPIGILVEGFEGRIELVNRKGVEHIACGSPDDWIGRTIQEMIQHFVPRIHDASLAREAIRQATLEGREVQDLEVVIHDPAERILLLFISPVYSADGERLGRVWLSRDVTDERRLEEQLRHSQKLETIGTLSGGIAHDFNNQLAVILGNTRHVQRELAALESIEPDTLESLGDLERAASHCAQLTRSLLAFARRTPVSLQSLDTARVMEDLEELLRPLLPSSIEMVIDVESALPRVSADPTQLQQVLLNLAVNARDAMKERGKLAIRARSRELGPEEARNIVGARPGSFIELSVSDTGSGLSPEVLSRVFEPFFTTKPVGEGTGLGLAIVHGVVNAHGGWLEVESDPGCGSTFRVLLPVADSAVLDGDSPVPAQPDAQGETILVVDDEATIRRLVKLELSRCGYCVREATNGAEAVERVRSDPGEIDLVVMDLTMPVLDGLEARAAILGLAPGMPVLLTSGRPPEARVEDEANPLGFLAKPYPMSQLTHRIRELLDRRCPG